MLLTENEKPTFFVDAMLGNLATKLRLMGYDTAYSSDIEDEELINRAKQENRVIISKDEELSNSAKNQKLDVILITKDNEIDQFIEINNKMEFGEFEISAKNSRCPVCNGRLNSVDPKSVSEKIPKGVLENTQDFWMCDDCSKIYWEGTHIINLQKFVGELNERL